MADKRVQNKGFALTNDTIELIKYLAIVNETTMSNVVTQAINDACKAKGIDMELVLAAINRDRG